MAAHVRLDETKRHYKKTASSDTVLHGLKKYTNYTMQVLATTAGGDGVRSAPIHCQTEPDGKKNDLVERKKVFITF